MQICLVVPLIFLGLKFFERHLLIWLFGDIEGKVLTTNSVIKSKKKKFNWCFHVYQTRGVGGSYIHPLPSGKR